MQKLEPYLMFWIDGELISKFVCQIMPQPGQLWSVPLGSDNLDASKEGRTTIKVLIVEISPRLGFIEVNVKAEYSPSLANLTDEPKGSSPKPSGLEDKPRTTWSEHQPLER